MALVRLAKGTSGDSIEFVSFRRDFPAELGTVERKNLHNRAKIDSYLARVCLSRANEERQARVRGFLRLCGEVRLERG